MIHLSPLRGALLVVAMASWVMASQGCVSGGPSSTATLVQSVTTDSGPTTIVGTVTGPCQLAIDFGSVPTGVASKGQLQVGDQGRTAVTFSAANGTLNAAFNVALGAAQEPPLAAGASASFPISFLPTQSGKVTSSLTIPVRGAAGLCGSSGAIVLNLTGTGAQLGPLSVTPSAIDFGKAVINTPSHKTVTLSNGSGALIAGIACAVSGADATVFEVSGCPDSLPAGGSASVDVIYEPLDLETRSVAVVTFAGEGTAPATLDLAGEPISTALALSPSAIDFGYVPLDTTMIGCTTATNQTSMLVTITGVTSFEDQGGAYGVATIDDAIPPNPFSFPITIPGGGSAKLCFSFTPAFTMDFTLGQASFSSDNTPGAEPAVSLTGWGGGPQISCAPTSAVFAPTLEHTRATLPVICTNTGTSIPGVDLNIAPPTASPSAFEAQFDEAMDPYPLDGLAPGESVQIDVSYSPISTAGDTGALLIKSNGGKGQAIQIPLSGQGLGIAPCQFVISPTALDFANVAVGDISLPLSFQIANVGTDICLVQSLAIKDDLAGNFHILSTSIAPDPQTQWITIPAPAPGADASLTVQLDFSPGGGGLFSAEAAFQISSINAPNQVVPLTGTSEGTCLRVEPSSLRFETVGENSFSELCASPGLSFTVSDACAGQATIAGVRLQSGPGDIVPQFSLPSGPSLPSSVTAISGGTSFTLFFEPTVVGTHVGQLLVSDGTVETAIELIGTAVSAGTLTDSFTVGPPKADVLFVMDVATESGSQLTLLDAGPGFFQAAGGIDYRVALTTDNDNPAIATAEFGRLLPCPTCSVIGAVPTVISASSVPAGESSPDPATAFANLVNAVPTDGFAADPPEDKRFFVALLDALGWGPAPGVDFFRAGAAFAAITVNDDNEDDSSQLATGDHDAAWYASSFESFFTGGPGFSWNYFSSGTPPTGNGFIDPTNLPLAIKQMVSATGGIAVNAADSSSGAALDSLWTSIVNDANQYPLSGTPTSEGSIAITIDGTQIAENAGPGNPNWIYDALSNAISFTPNAMPKVGDSISITYAIGCQ